MCGNIYFCLRQVKFVGATEISLLPSTWSWCTWWRPPTGGRPSSPASGRPPWPAPRPATRTGWPSRPWGRIAGWKLSVTFSSFIWMNQFIFKWLKWRRKWLNVRGNVHPVHVVCSLQNVLSFRVEIKYIFGIRKFSSLLLAFMATLKWQNILASSSCPATCYLVSRLLHN